VSDIKVRANGRKFETKKLFLEANYFGYILKQKMVWDFKSLDNRMSILLISFWECNNNKNRIVSKFKQKIDSKLNQLIFQSKKM